MQIRDIRATTVTVPLEAPLRHANGCHWGRFVRTIVEVETDTGLIGLGEMGGGGESAEAVFRAMKAYLVGHDPARLEEMRFLIANPTASLYNNRTQVLAALEFACLDILGQAWGVPVCDILGGRLRDRVPFATYCFFRYPNPAFSNKSSGAGEVRTIDQLVETTRAMKSRFGFTTHKLKGGVFPPDYELEAYRALAAAFPEDSLRFDPNAVWSTEQAIRFGQAIEPLRNDYFEDPVFGLNGMRRTREMVRIPLATNTVVVNFEQLAANALNTAVDVILLDTTFWGGIRPCLKAAGVCETFQLGVAVHSSGELGIQLATMLHLGAVLPNLSFAADAHYHHLTDDIIEGGLMQYEGGAIRSSEGPWPWREAQSRKARRVQRTLQAPGRLSIRSGSGASRLDSHRSQRPLGRSPGRTRTVDSVLNMSTLFDLSGRVAVVIGATSGIGRAIAIALAEQGADVVPTGRRKDGVESACREIGALGRRTFEHTSNVAHRGSIDVLRDAVLAHFGRVDILVNAAGFTFRKPTIEVSEEQWTGVMDTNLNGALRACQAFYEPLKASGRGRVINIASLGSYLGFHEVAAYCASKSALLSLTRSLAVRMGARRHYRSMPSRPASSRRR